MNSLERSWYSSRARVWLLPAEWLFRGLAGLRRGAYRIGLLRSHKLAVPVIVVGNISVGGTGKTPLVVWLVKLLRKAGYRPGIVARGYGGQAQRWPQQVRHDSDPRMVGDEPVMLARRCACPLVAGPDRVTAAQQLLKHARCDVIIADDGLQHYRLQRDIELAVLDGERRFGNGHCLPAGPLREPASRLNTVDFIIANGAARRGEFAMDLAPQGLKPVTGEGETLTFQAFAGQRVHGVAGIGNPQRFFQLLRSRGLEVTEHAFPDHHVFSAEDLSFADELPIVMTEKDAVKCRLLDAPRMWYVPVEARLPEALALCLLQMLKQLTG
ncbi:tetraacyldisaccharide 4'-kinase [Candidatus Tenderia electrophaga]|jgi:tetraacyldisaccharide 4'-kinase|uniref:Tetraacyldisaccharide 4'-kinase n=1 Tax=Candidatus Tenderia electrophaga TaxID=1748243 RepID=A0A0S2TE43_9GAMM|nr:tetraacyldisaccharide 4'-kinase [Candidatus Tenderia electrophaga]